MDQLQQAVARNQELEYLLQTKEMKVGSLIHEMGHHVQ